MRHKPINTELQWKDWSQSTLNSLLSQRNGKICPLFLEMWYHTSKLVTRVQFRTVDLLPGATIQNLFLMCHWPLCLLVPYVTAIQWKKQCSIWALYKVNFFCNFCVSPRTSQQKIPSLRDIFTSKIFASSKPILRIDYKRASWQSPTSLECPVTLSMQKKGKWVSPVGYQSTGSTAGLFVCVLLQRWFQSWVVLLGTPTHQYKCCLYNLGK